MKYMIFLTLLLVGCNNTSFQLSDTELTQAEGFIAVSVANHNIRVVKEENARIEEAARIEAEANRVKAEAEAIQVKAMEEAAIKKAEEEKKVETIKVPSKYLRLFSAEAGCGPCIHQDQILTGSDWIIKNGTEKDNQEDIKYNGLKETVPTIDSADNPLWKKYKAPSVPFWQLIENGKVVKTYAGVLNLRQLHAFYTQTSTEKHNNPNCKCDECKCGPNCQCK